MRMRLSRQISFVLMALFVAGLCLVSVAAQTRRKRSRRITNPVINTPAQTSARPTSTTDASIISTAEDQNATEASERPAPTRTRRTPRTRTPATAEADPDGTQRTINQLSTQVTLLSSKLSEMEQQQRTLVDLERLSRAETRAEGLRAQLRDVEDKRGNLEARAEQIEYEIKPENIERSVSAFGSTHPEELRDMRRRQLEGEQKRVLSQLETMKASQSRLESAIASADADAERIRARIDAVSNSQQNADANSSTSSPDNSTTLIAPTSNPSDTGTTPLPPPRTTETTPSSTPR
jgi:hypothetical protein